MIDDSKIGDWVLYKNNQLIAFNKPAGIGVQEDKTKEKSLHQLAEIYCQHPLHVIHRIDRPASGIVLFAKTKTAMVTLNQQFRNRTVKKYYKAVVKEPLSQNEGTLVHYLVKDGQANKSSAHDRPLPGSKRAELYFKTTGHSDNYHLLDIELITGRHHQIRTQLAAMGSPIKGDVKYGFRRSNPDRSIHLHAWKLYFQHPVTKAQVELEAPVPSGDPVWSAVMR